MKKITFLLSLLVCTAVAKAQDCGATNVPYYLDFESDTPQVVPDCTLATTTEGGNSWAEAANPNDSFSGNVLQYTGGPLAADAWFFTRGINLTAGTYYKITYKYASSSASNTESFVATYGMAANPESATNLSVINNLTDVNLHNASFSYFSVATTGVYYFGFHALSAANQGNIYIDDFNIAPSTCGTPGNLLVSGITQTGAILTWDPTSGGNVSPLSIYQYAFVTTNTAPDSGSYTYTTSQAVTNLLPGTTYYAFVRGECGAGVWGDWVSKTFTTPGCDATTVPYTQDFETATAPALPNCTLVGDTTGNNWITATAPGNGFDNTTLQYSGSDAAANAWFFTQGIQLTAGNYYKVTYKYGNNSATTTEGLQATIGTSPNAASVMSPIGGQDAITGGTSGTFTSGPISVPADGVYYFGFNAISAASQGNLFVDDITVTAWECGTPQNITITNITQTSATVSWTAPTENTSFGYFFAYATSDATPAGGPYIPGLTTSLADLTPGTTYYVFVKSQCGPLMGDWTQAYSFTTPACDAATVPYYLDFEAATLPQIPECTIVGNVDTGNQWATAGNPGNGFTTNVLQYLPSDETANAWFFTQGVQLTAGTYYKISYNFGNDSANTSENLRVTVGTNPNPAFVLAGNPLAEHVVTGGTQQSNAINYFNVTESGVYYFGFNAHSASEEGNLYVDNIAVEENVCGTPANTVVTDVTDTTATIIWELPVTGNMPVSVYQYAYGTTDTPPSDGNFMPDYTANLTGLEPGTAYYVFTRTQCGPLWSDWTVTQFTTQVPAGLGDVTFKDFAVYPNPTSHNITIDNTTAIDKVELYNITGQLVLRQNIGSTNTAINLEPFAAGAYLLNVYANGAAKRVKIIKQ